LTVKFNTATMQKNKLNYLLPESSYRYIVLERNNTVYNIMQFKSGTSMLIWTDIKMYLRQDVDIIIMYYNISILKGFGNHISQ